MKFIKVRKKTWDSPVEEEIYTIPVHCIVSIATGMGNEEVKFTDIILLNGNRVTNVVETEDEIKELIKEAEDAE